MSLKPNNNNVTNAGNHLTDLLMDHASGQGIMSKKYYIETSLVAQWLRSHLPMQGTQVRAVVREDPTYCRATKPVRHNY